MNPDVEVELGIHGFSTSCQFLDTRGHLQPYEDDEKEGPNTPGTNVLKYAWQSISAGDRTPSGVTEI